MFLWIPSPSDYNLSSIMDCRSWDQHLDKPDPPVGGAADCQRSSYRMARPPLRILDGSTGHELKERLGVLGTAADSFSTAMYANTQHPDLVTSVHADYVAAGCDVLTTNSFTLTPAVLTAAHELPALLHAACRCAGAAAATAGGGRQVLVAGCLPPLNHCYLPELVLPHEEMLAQYQLLVRELAPRVDLFLAETLCSSAEAHAALQAAAASAKPCWLSLTLHDHVDGGSSPPVRLRGGESVSETLASLRASKLAPTALLYNCCAPQVVTAALRAMPIPPPGVDRLGGYANGFASTTSQWLAGGGATELGGVAARHEFAGCPTCAAEYSGPESTIKHEAYCAHAESWVDSGASVVGGCCGIGPGHMRATVRRLRPSE